MPFFRETEARSADFRLLIMPDCCTSNGHMNGHRINRASCPVLTGAESTKARAKNYEIANEPTAARRSRYRDMRDALQVAIPTKRVRLR